MHIIGSSSVGCTDGVEFDEVFGTLLGRFDTRSKELAMEDGLIWLVWKIPNSCIPQHSQIMN